MIFAISINKEIGNNIYVGLATDTGNFKYSCISGDTLRAAGELIDLGVDFASISKAAFDTKPKAYYDLMGIAIGKLRMVCDGKAAALYLESEDFKFKIQLMISECREKHPRKNAGFFKGYQRKGKIKRLLLPFGQ